MSGTDGGRRADGATERGAVTGTHADALRRGRADAPDGATKLGVVRRPPGGFRAAVDENLPALGPPASLLEAFRRERDDMQMRGLCEEGAHNAAWDAVGFDERYRAYVTEDGTARAALASVRERVASGEDVTLVGVENAEKRRSHRTALEDLLERDG